MRDLSICCRPLRPLRAATTPALQWHIPQLPQHVYGRPDRQYRQHTLGVFTLLSPQLPQSIQDVGIWLPPPRFQRMQIRTSGHRTQFPGNSGLRAPDLEEGLSRELRWGLQLSCGDRTTQSLGGQPLICQTAGMEPLPLWAWRAEHWAKEDVLEL